MLPRQGFLKGGPWTVSISITWKIATNAHYLSFFKHTESKTLRMVPQKTCILTRPLNDVDVSKVRDPSVGSKYMSLFPLSKFRDKEMTFICTRFQIYN